MIFISLPAIVITPDCCWCGLWRLFLSLCLCPAKLVANISLTLTGDTTTQIMAPTVGGGFKIISVEFEPTNLAFSKWKISFGSNKKKTLGCPSFPLFPIIFQSLPLHQD